jgi:regulation of enolase protein 1 (concanavalin A-like superfamily)
LKTRKVPRDQYDTQVAALLRRTRPTKGELIVKLTALRVYIAALAVVAFSGEARAQSLPGGWSTADIGAVGATGSASGSGGSFTVTGAGADIWGTADAFRFVYTTLSGDGSVVANVTSVQYVAAWTKAGVMMRETLAPGSRHGFMLVSAGKGLAFQRRVNTNDISTNTSIAGTAPHFVRLTRAGNTITAATSIDGSTWATVGSDTIAMASTIYVGLAVSSHVAGTLATATFDSTAVTAASATTGTETLVFMRHGEKPTGGYGQLTCQGLQRSIALPAVLISHYGNAQYVFAPNPAVMVPDAAGSFYYVRPLATIEPTAIRLGLPVNVQFGYTNISGLQGALVDPNYANSTIYIAWEHLYLQQVVQNLMNAYGGGVTVPAWSSTDYDSLYVVRLTYANGTITGQFTHDYEGLNNLTTVCPN